MLGTKDDFEKRLIMGFIVVFLMTYGVVLAIYYVEGNDYHTHAAWAQEISLNNILEFYKNKISYPIWHVMVRFCTALMKIEASSAVAIITALLNSIAYLSVVAVYRIWSYDKFKSEFIFWITALFIVGPLYAPWFNKRYYLGQTIPNAWHNPTNIAVKGFAILTFGLLVYVLKSEKKRKYSSFLITAIALFSAFAKPSFLQGMIPGIGIFIILRLCIERKEFDFLKYFKICLCFVPALVVLYMQTMTTFYNQNYMRQSTIAVGWGKVLHNWTPNLFVSFFLSFAFPLFVLLVNFRKLIHKKEIQLLLCYEIAAWLEGALLYETGEKLMHGNFIWASMTSGFVVWMTMLYYYVEMIYGELEGDVGIRKRSIRLIGGGLFTMHLLFGIFYWWQRFF